ncbi:hypothetical protein EMPS_06811 [Entomortierella parvispora]|uniref:Uncharacterized protein n=1 Tax=Entomortierella parvispora TaxID=205924 RepID=A0A9P3LXU0_9FUNG|nr:hypothetical protein EMPS_06811 [Entomortierella parvispora]
MNRNANGNGLPFHANSPSRRSASGNPFTMARRISPGRLFILVGLGFISLVAITRILFGSNGSHSSSAEQDAQNNAASDAERELKVQQILDTRTSAYSFDDFTEQGLVFPGNEHLMPATAILLGWKRLEGLKLIVSYLARYPYIKEIIVWNNNKENVLSRRDFEMDPSFGPLPELQVFNAKENLHDFAKYMSCSLAKYQHCYFQDDDWLNTHMDALYTNFLTAPNLIHTNTLPMIHMEHRRWTFTNEEYKMHAGFSWMGTGSFLPREKAQRLLEQGGNSNLAKDRIKVIDMYFSIWTNQYPYQLVNYLTPLDQKNGWSTEGVSDHWSIVFRNMLDAADRLYSALVANPEVSEKDYFPRDEDLPVIKDRHARSPCFNDKCLFKTSMDAFPEPKAVVFNGNLQTIEEQNQKFIALPDYPTNEFFDKFAYNHAVDNDPETCWNSFKAPQPGDSFGLQFVKGTALRKFTVNSSKSLAHLEGKFSVQVSDHAGVEWTICKHTVRFPTSTSMALDINCPSAPHLAKGLVNNVKIEFDQSVERSLEVCGMNVGGMVL